jgi:hypothetical protein
MDAPATPMRSPPREPASEIIRRAEALSIPWERLLLDEIQAEQTLRRHAVDAGAEMPVSAALTILPSSFLNSWRVRDRILTLSCEARGAAFRKAVSELRMVIRRLIGQPGGGRAAFSGHLWLAYQRVLLLQRVCRAARKSRGADSERLAFICSTTSCSFDDAAWAVCLEGSPRSGHRLDAAIRKARDEGFQIPRAPTEARSFSSLRRIIRGSPRSNARRPSSVRSRDPYSVPGRVGLPADAI